MDVFISYSSKDQERVISYAQALRNAGLSVWLDQWKIIAGDEITREVERGLEDSEFLILMLSELSIKSGWVEREWRTKFQSEIECKQTTVICVRLDKCTVPTLLAGKKYIDAFAFDSLDSAAGVIVEAIKEHQSRRFSEPILRTAREVAEDMGSHRPVALIRIRDAASAISDKLSPEEVIEVIEAETSFLLAEYEHNVALSKEKTTGDSGGDESSSGLEPLFEMLRMTVQQNAEANLRELQTWKRRLLFFRERGGMGSEALLLYLLHQLDTLIDESTSVKNR